MYRKYFTEIVLRLFQDLEIKMEENKYCLEIQSLQRL